MDSGSGPSNKNLVYPAGSESDLTDHKIDNSLICVNFPGKVVNAYKAVEMLGGQEELSHVFNNAKPKLELRLRPRNVYCHKINGDRSSTTGLLIKVRANKRTNEISSVNIEGVVGTEYKFNGMADYTYMPIQKVGDKTQCTYSDLVPEGLQDTSYLDKHKKEPLFIPPAVFSRLESHNLDMFKKDTDNKAEEGNESLISTNRANRRTYGISVQFSLTEDVPQQANRASFDSIRLKLVSEEKINQIKKLFQQRPVWIRNRICEVSGLTKDTLKSLLPIAAFFYTSGPWRMCLVRFGYDPRKDFHSRYYQPMDFRVRKFGDMREFIQKKVTKHRLKPSAVFDETTIPETKLKFYQYCDIKLPKVQEMLAKVPQGICHEKRGWLPSGFDEQVRQLMSDVAQRNYSKLQQTMGSDTASVGPDEDEETLNRTSDDESDFDEGADSQDMSVDET